MLNDSLRFRKFVLQCFRLMSKVPTCLANYRGKMLGERGIPKCFKSRVISMKYPSPYPLPETNGANKPNWFNQMKFSSKKMMAGIIFCTLQNRPAPTHPHGFAARVDPRRKASRYTHGGTTRDPRRGHHSTGNTRSPPPPHPHPGGFPPEQKTFMGLREPGGSLRHTQDECANQLDTYVDSRKS